MCMTANFYFRSWIVSMCWRSGLQWFGDTTGYFKGEGSAWVGARCWVRGWVGEDCGVFQKVLLEQYLIRVV